MNFQDNFFYKWARISVLNFTTNLFSAIHHSSHLHGDQLLWLIRGIVRWIMNMIGIIIIMFLLLSCPAPPPPLTDCNWSAPEELTAASPIIERSWLRWVRSWEKSAVHGGTVGWAILEIIAVRKSTANPIIITVQFGLLRLQVWLLQVYKLLFRRKRGWWTTAKRDLF